MSQRSGLARLWAELRRRKVVRVAIAYAVIAWGLIEFSATVEEPLGLPAWTDTLVIVMLAIGLPVAIVLSWVFDIGPGGLKVTAEPERREATVGEGPAPADERHAPVADNPAPSDEGPAVAGTGRPVPVGEGRIVGHFAILERLGEGGMGVVYRARDTRLDRLVALKFLPSHLDADAAAARRFLQEARTAARLDHPNICTVHEIATLDDGRSFIAMPLYQGRTLGSLELAGGRMPQEEAAELGAQAARGLAAAHAAGIVHRDIKPANLFLTREGVLKILDFGIAKTAGVELTREGSALGTIAYMSPEQVRGQPLDGRADLWSLGVVLYELCTGERPFIGLQSAAVLHAILELDPPTLRQMLPRISPELSRVVERCLAKDPDQRPATANEVANVLARVAAGQGAVVTSAGADDEAAPEVRAEAAPDEPSSATLVPGGERRQTTILRAELAGVSLLEESLSPEESDRLAAACHATVEEVVAAHGGLVNVRTPEAWQALFGIPSAREDDATRAVRAARALTERLASTVAGFTSRGGVGVRCGIDTGRAVVRTEDTGGSRYRVVGGPAERSSWIAAQTAAGDVLLSEDCLRLVRPFFETEPAGELPARGEDAPTALFRVIRESGVQSRLEAAAAIGLTELRGRDSELDTLLRACEAAATGEGRFISITGEAGVGKSRLLYELDRRIDRDRFEVVHGRCQSFAGEVPYLPFIDILRDRLGLIDREGELSEALIAERLRTVAPELESFTPFYLQLLSIVDEERTLQEGDVGENLRVGLVESLSALLTLGAQNRPTVVLLEDWHWVDAASRPVLGQLLEMVSAYPLLIVLTARPEGQDWGAPASHTPIVLGPLTPEDSASLVRSVLKADVAEPLARFLHDRTGGNPFFLEEVCHTLTEDGTLRVEQGKAHVEGSLIDLELPETVQGVLRTRLDRLDGEARRLVCYAAVVGREFGREVLEHALGESQNLSRGLERLRELGLIQQIRVVPEITYRFKHALTQDVAYDGLLERQRAEMHGAVADAIEALYVDSLEAPRLGVPRARVGDDQLDRLSEHFAEAGRWAKAVEYGLAACDRLWSMSEFSEAADVQERALEWVQRMEDPGERFELRVEILLRHERLHEFLGLRDRQQTIIDELMAMLDPKEHVEQLTHAHVRQGDLSILLRDYERAEMALDTALRLSEDLDDASLERRALRSLGLLCWHQQRYAESAEFVERALALDRAVGNEQGIVGDLSNLGSLYRAMGEYETALEFLQEALDLERRIGGGTWARKWGDLAVVRENYMLHVMGSIYTSLGEYEKAREHLEAAMVAPGVANVVQRHFNLTAIAHLTLKEGRVEEALEYYREAVSVCQNSRHLTGLTTSLRLLGEVLLNLGRHAEALPNLERAAELYGHVRDWGAEGKMWRGVAVAREALGEPEAARAAWSTACEGAERANDRALRLESIEGVARLSRREDPAGALRAYQEAIDLAAALRQSRRVGELRYATGILHWEFAAYREALASFEAAFEDLEAAGATPEAGLALNSVGRTLRDLGRLDEAKERLRTSVDFNRTSGEALLQAHALATLGDVHLDAGEPAEAQQCFATALDLRKELDDRVGQGWMCCRLAKTQHALGSADGVTYYLDEAEAIAQATRDPDLSRECDDVRRLSRASSPGS